MEMEGLPQLIQSCDLGVILTEPFSVAVRDVLWTTTLRDFGEEMLREYMKGMQEYFKTNRGSEIRTTPYFV